MQNSVESFCDVSSKITRLWGIDVKHSVVDTFFVSVVEHSVRIRHFRVLNRSPDTAAFVMYHGRVVPRPFPFIICENLFRSYIIMSRIQVVVKPSYKWWNTARFEVCNSGVTEDSCLL
jgi:hypothetical protein